MGRLSLLVFLVVVVPVTVFWFGQGMTAPGETLDRFKDQVASLGGGLPEPTVTPKPEPEPDPERDPEPDTPKPAPDPERPKPDPEPDPIPTPKDPEALFAAGRFAPAAEAFTGKDARKRGLALLGQAFLEAFPPDTPRGEYLVVKTQFGDEYDGFATTSGDMVKLTTFAGKSQTVPNKAISSRRPLTLDAARDRVAQRARDESRSDKAKGSRVFALIQESCRADRPDGVAVLLARALELDQDEPYFLSSVRNRVPSERQGALYRAFLDCELPQMEAIETASTTPTTTPPKINGTRPKPPPVEATSKNPKVAALMTKARPMRVAGLRQYRAIVRKGVRNAGLAAVNEAITSLQGALDLYEKAVLIEESDAIYGMLRPLSRYVFQLRFWKQQLEGR